MKSILIILSVVCLSFTFTKDYFDNTETPDATVSATPVTSLKGAKMTSVSDVVTAALAFKAMLTTSQQATLEQTYTATLAHKWSNLPCGASCRNGIQFSTLNTAQLTAALAVVQAAAGVSAHEGYDEFLQILSADSLLGVSSGGGGGYGKGIYFISFLNTPSTTGAWMLQFGGHHYAGNIAFNNGKVTGCTPRFEGVEPRSFTTASGRVDTPIEQEHTALVAMFAGLSSTELASAQITGTFSDVVLGPGQDGNFPAIKVGLNVGSLSAAKQALVLNAMKPWVMDADTATARALLAIYQNELAGTYIAWSGSSALTANGNYARIDGPSVWIEFACQAGVVFTATHFHTIHRDHTRDYGNNLTGSPIDTATGSTGGVGITGVRSMATISIYPNPAGDFINAALPARISSGTINVVNATTGQVVMRSSNITGTGVGLDIAKLPSGAYILRIEEAGSLYAGRFTKL